MTQSKNNTITIDLSDHEQYLSDYTMNSSVITSSSNLDSITISNISTDTIDLNGYATSSNDQFTFDYDNIKIVPTLWTETLPDVDTVNAMCAEYPGLAKAYENFQTVYKLVEQDYKGKEEDNT